MSAKKTYVVSFRTTHRVIEAANKELDRLPVACCKDHNQLARKLLIDFVNGKVKYDNKLDRISNPATNHAED